MSTFVASRPDVAMQAQYPVPGHLVTGVVQKPCGGHEVLDMGCFGGSLPHGQLYLDQIAVMPGPHEHRLPAKVHAALVGLQNPVGNRELQRMRHSSD